MADDAVRAALTQWVPEYQPNLHASLREAASSITPSDSLRAGLKNNRQASQS